MTKVYLPTIMRKEVDGRPVVEGGGETVAQVLGSVVTAHPPLKRHLYGENGDLLRHVLVILNGEDIRSLQGVRTTVSAHDELQLLPAMAGG